MAGPASSLVRLLRRVFLGAEPLPPDPLAAWDGLIETLERQSAQLRQSAATLLALRGQLRRDVDRYQTRVGDLERRFAEAEGRGDAPAARVLRRDLDEVGRLLDLTRQGVAKVEADVEILLAAGESQARQLTELRLERTSAAARLTASEVMTSALKAQVARFDDVLALDAARDEVERAHALAEIYREGHR